MASTHEKFNGHQPSFREIINVDDVNRRMSVDVLKIGKTAPDSPDTKTTFDDEDEDELIDHTAALLGIRDDEDEDDERERCFSPEISSSKREAVDPETNEHRELRADHIITKMHDDSSSCKQKVVLTETTDDLVDATNEEHKHNQQADSVRVSSNTTRAISGCDKEESKSTHWTKADDSPFFFFDPKLVAKTAGAIGGRRCTDQERYRKQAMLKAGALRERASSALRHKAQKTVEVMTLQPVLRDRKNCKLQRDETEQKQGIEGNPSMDSICNLSDTFSNAMAAPSVTNNGGSVHKSKGLPESCVGNAAKTMALHSTRAVHRTYSGMKFSGLPKPAAHSSHGSSNPTIQICNGMKIPNFAAVQMRDYIEDVATKTGKSVIGDMQRAIKQQGKDKQTNCSSETSSPPAITTTASTVSSNNSMSCIDEDGFLISPTSSLDNFDIMSFGSGGQLSTNDFSPKRDSQTPLNNSTGLPRRQDPTENNNGTSLSSNDKAYSDKISDKKSVPVNDRHNHPPHAKNPLSIGQSQPGHHPHSSKHAMEALKKLKPVALNEGKLRAMATKFSNPLKPRNPNLPKTAAEI